MDWYIDFEAALKDERFIAYKERIYWLVTFYGYNLNEATEIAQEDYPEFKPVYDSTKWKVS